MIFDAGKIDPFLDVILLSGTGLSKGVRLAWSHLPAQGPTALLVALVDAEGRPGDYGFSFAGTLLVSWPLDASLFWEAVRRIGGAVPAAT